MNWKIEWKMPDRKFLGGFAVGLLWGLVAMFIGGTLYLRHALIIERECKADFETSLAIIEQNAGKLRPWSIQKVACGAQQTPDGLRITGLRLCNANYAAMILQSPDDRKFAAAIPCGLALYQKPDGRTYLSKVNMPLFARIFGGAPAYLFPEKIAPEQSFLLSGVLKTK